MDPKWVRVLRWFVGIVLLVFFLGIVVSQVRAGHLREFHGKLACNMAAPGGETTGTIILTQAGAYELDLADNPEARLQLPTLDGQQVIVIGVLRIRKGIEVRQRRIIRVHELKLDAPA